MTPPIRPIVGGAPVEIAPPPPATPSPLPSSGNQELFRPSALNSLRHEISSPFRSTRPISTLGDIQNALVYDFIQAKLGEGARVVQLLGSFPGYLHPDTPLQKWDPDKKPDLNIVGDAESILRRLAPMMGWDDATLRGNLRRARAGMVYFNLALDTRAGPVPFKMGIIDERVLNRGEPYFSLRASLLPERGSYVYLNQDPEFRSRFEEWTHQNKTNFFEHTLDSFLFRKIFSADQLAERRFQIQFTAYEGLYRGVFEWTKGAKHAERLGPWIPEIMVPAIRGYMETNRDLKAYSPGLPGVPLTPQQVTEDNFHGLSFTLDRSGLERTKAFLGRMGNFFLTNFRILSQTLRNKASNGTSRPGYHGVNGLKYVLRKFGLNTVEHPRSYTTESSFFPNQEARKGQTDTPLRQMVILAGYDPGNEEVPKVFEEIRNYAAAEIDKGALPNPLFRGVEPSKFTLPIRGVPSVAFQLMNGLESEGITHFVLAGTEDTRVVFDRFQEFYADEIASRGKTFEFVPMGNSFTANLRRAIEKLPYKGENVAMSMGDNPLIDVERMVNHPERHIVDWAVGPNSRTMLAHDGGKNYHVDGQAEGVHHPVKEGNAYIYTGDVARVPWDLLQAIFNSRKSMAEAGTKSKLRLILDILFSPSLGRPGSTIDSVYFFADLVARSGSLELQRLFGRPVPPAALGQRLSERTLQSRLGVRSSLKPNHTDAGGVLDIDGVGDLAIAKSLLENTEHPERIYPHWDKLAPFADYLKENASEELPALENTPKRLNRLYERLYDAFLEMNAPRGRVRRALDYTYRKLGLESLVPPDRPRFTPEKIQARGFTKDNLPFLEDGSVNPVWKEKLLPEQDFQYYRKGFEAYQNRAIHAEGLLEDFQTRVEATRPVPDAERVKPEIQSFALSRLNIDPERSRSHVIEWNFGRITQGLVNEGRKKYGIGSPQVAELERYIEQSTTGNYDTSLRRVLTGLKAVDVLRRSEDFLSPEEFRAVYPYLTESIHEAEGAARGNGRLRGWFSFAQSTGDRSFVRRVGESPPAYRTQGLANLLDHSNGRQPIYRVGANGEGPGEVRRVDSAAMHPEDVSLLAYKLNVMPSRIPHLIAAASGADVPDRLGRISAARMTPERLMAWAQSADGKRYMEGRASVFEDNFRNRFVEGAPGLGLGIASLFGAEYLANQIGLDARRYPHERFGFVVGLSHVMGQAGGAVQEVLLNRSLGQPFSFVESRMVQSGSDYAVQFGFQARSSASRSILASLARNFGGAEGGLISIAGRGIKGAATMPFRAAWGMGAGLMSSALIDKTIGQTLFADNPQAREYLRFGSFFVPDLYRIGVGTRGPAIFESAGMRWATRAFAAGFIADMLFQGGMRLNYGSDRLGTLNGIYARANELHNADRGTLSGLADGAFELVSPSLAAWWDSVEFEGLSLRPNRYQRQAREEMQQFSSATTEQARDLLRHAMVYGVQGQGMSPSFYSRVDFNFLRGDNQLGNFSGPSGRELPVEQVFQQLNYPEIHQRIMVEGNREQQVTYIQRQYRGYRLSRQESEAILDRINLYQLRQNIGGLQGFQIAENADMRSLFDESGALRSGTENTLNRFVFNQGEVSDAEVLRLRRVGLAYRILELQSSDTPAARRDLAAYQGVAREVGLLDASGHWIASPVIEEARSQFQAQQQATGNTGVPLTFQSSFPSESPPLVASL